MSYDNDAALKYLTGQSIVFPIELVDGKPELISGIELIRSELKTLLAWPHGTRFFDSDYGCMIHDLIEEPNDNILKSLVEHYIIKSISLYEPRIVLLEAIINRPNDDQLEVILKYKLANSKTEDTVVFPIK